MKKNISYTIISAMIFCLALISCSEEKRDILIPYPTDITFEDIELERFSYNIPNAPFTSGDEQSGIITANVVNNGDGTFTGFAPSNRNFRSYPWDLSPDYAPAGGLAAAEVMTEINSTIMSCMTVTPNRSGNFLVGSTNNDDASITLSNAAVVEHVLVTNTSFAYLTETYGSIYSDTYIDLTGAYDINGGNVRNPNIPNTSMTGRFTLPALDGTFLVNLQDDDYVQLSITGYISNTATGSVSFYFAVNENIDPDNPTHSYILDDWRKVDLTSLGTVDRLVFNITSSYIDAPSYFCLDGIRIQK